MQLACVRRAVDDLTFGNPGERQRHGRLFAPAANRRPDDFVVRVSDDDSTRVRDRVVFAARPTFDLLRDSLRASIELGQHWRTKHGTN